MRIVLRTQVGPVVPAGIANTPEMPECVHVPYVSRNSRFLLTRDLRLSLIHQRRDVFHLRSSSWHGAFAT